jgi:hypothetical protein
MKKLEMRWGKEPKPTVLSIDERWEQGIDHNPKSVELYKFVAKLDGQNGDCGAF